MLIYAYLIPIPGFWALHRLFSEERASFLLSFWGMVLSILGSALYLVGIILFGVVLWKSYDMSLKIASISLILHGFLIILPEQVIVNFLSWAFFLLSSVIVIAYSQKYLGNHAIPDGSQVMNFDRFDLAQ